MNWPKAFGVVAMILVPGALIVGLGIVVGRILIERIRS